MYTSTERPLDAADVFTIWPGEGVPPGSEAWTWHEQAMQPPGSSIPNEMVRNVVVPTLTMFKPDAGALNAAPGPAMIVAPGGAFQYLMMHHEGYDVARWLAGLGVTAFVLKYRLCHTPEDDGDMPAFIAELIDRLRAASRTEVSPEVAFPTMEQARIYGIEDGRQAIRYLRRNADALGIDAGRIGIMGFSAGGAVAVNAALEYDVDSRPDFVAGIYPGHREVIPPREDAPPLFVVIADDDELVTPVLSARLYESWHKTGRPAVLHILGGGGHGFGLRKQNAPSDVWPELLESWLASRGYIAAL